jgi:hypothetical protein
MFFKWQKQDGRFSGDQNYDVMTTTKQAMLILPTYFGVAP